MKEEYTAHGFVSIRSDYTGGLSIMPCTYIVKKELDEVEVAIKKGYKAFPTFFYIGNCRTDAILKLTQWYMDKCNIIPDQQSLLRALKGVGLGRDGT